MFKVYQHLGLVQPESSGWHLLLRLENFFVFTCEPSQ
jgi:hypothetical protein